VIFEPSRSKISHGGAEMKKTMVAAKEKAKVTPRALIDGKNWTDPMSGPFFNVSNCNV
jgi:hypothetical protein